MPATSKVQQMAAGAALSAKRRETPKSKLRGASKEMAESMSESELEAFASTRRKALPARKTTKKAAKRTVHKTTKHATPKQAATRTAAPKTARKSPAKKREAKKRAAR